MKNIHFKTSPMEFPIFLYKKSHLFQPFLLKWKGRSSAQVILESAEDAAVTAWRILVRGSCRGGGVMDADEDGQRCFGWNNNNNNNMLIVHIQIKYIFRYILIVFLSEFESDARNKHSSRWVLGKMLFSSLVMVHEWIRFLFLHLTLLKRSDISVPVNLAFSLRSRLSPLAESECRGRGNSSGRRRKAGMCAIYAMHSSMRKNNHTIWNSIDDELCI